MLWHKMGVRFFVETAALLSVLDCSINVTILLYEIHVLVTTVDMISFNFISLVKWTKGYKLKTTAIFMPMILLSPSCPSSRVRFQIFALNVLWCHYKLICHKPIFLTYVHVYLNNNLCSMMCTNLMNSVFFTLVKRRLYIICKCWKIQCMKKWLGVVNVTFWRTKSQEW